jgi:NodT family efflux transporter outer membrane factor (OMF) lipoprotein
VGLAGFLLGCSAAPPVSHPDLGLAIPEQWASASTASIDIEESWVSSFNDAKLEAIVMEAVEHNHDLKAAAARLSAAAATARIVGADLLPRISAGFNGSRQRQNFVGLPIPGFEDDVLSTKFNLFGVSLDTTWELDVWGRIRAGTSAAYADLEVVQADFAAARLSLAGQTAKAWFAVTEAKQQAALARKTRESYQITADQVRSRFERGLRPSLDLRLALSHVGTAEALYQERQEQYERAVRQLEILVGRYPDGIIAGADTLPDIPLAMPAGVPADVISRRPDLAAAERQLAAADARITQARAALYPRISLTTSNGTISDQLRDLTDGDFYVWSIAGNLLQPIFEGGRLLAEVDRTEAVAREALENYTAVALQAFVEVESALVAEALLAKREDALRTAAEQAIAAHALAQDRYRSGLENFTTVLDAQQRRLNAESQRIAVRRLRLDVRVNLHLALGGDFVYEHDAYEEEATPL